MKVHELLTSPERWTQNAYAKSPDGRDIWFDDPQAVCWCFYGAIRKCYPSTDTQIRVIEAVRAHLPEDGCNIVQYNDTPGRTYEEIYNLVKELDV